MIVIIFIIFLKLYRLFSLKPFKHKICFPLKPEIYFPYRVSILVHFRFFTFQEVNLLSSGNRVSVSVEPCLNGLRSGNGCFLALLDAVKFHDLKACKISR